MSNKISPETLVALDLIRAEHEDSQLPTSTAKWIEEHGKPNIEEVLYEQRKVLGKQNINNKYIDTVMRIVKDHGAKSKEAIRMYRLANEHKVGLKKIATLTGVSQAWLYNAMHPSKEHDGYKNLLDKYQDVNTSEVRNYLKKLNDEGNSYYRISLWTGLSDAKVRKLILFAS